MIQFENVTNLKGFKKEVDSGVYTICKDGRVLHIAHHLYTTPYLYRLTELENGLYRFESENDALFSVTFRSSSNRIEIIEGKKGGRNYKADRYLRQFMPVLCLANSVLLLYDFEEGKCIKCYHCLTDKTSQYRCTVKGFEESIIVEPDHSCSHFTNWSNKA